MSIDESKRYWDTYTVKTNDGNTILTEESTGFGIKPEYAEFLKPGTVFTLETRGSIISGIQLPGNEWLFRKTDEELAEEHRQWVEKWNADRQANLDANREAWQAREDALPDWLKERFKTFHEMGGEEFARDGWSYELIVAELAVLYLDSPGGEDNPIIDAFAAEHGTSGNQHGFARGLAEIHRQEPERTLEGTAGALSPLTGDAFYEGKGNAKP